MELNLTAIERYLQDRARTPFFLFAERTALAELRRGLQAMGLHLLSLSTLCPSDDRLPLLDDVLQTLKERMRSGEKILLVGLGEYLALRGAAEAQNILLRLKDLPCAEGALVVLIGGLLALAEVLRADVRIAQGERRMAFFRSEAVSADGAGQGVDGAAAGASLGERRSRRSRLARALGERWCRFVSRAKSSALFAAALHGATGG